MSKLRNNKTYFVLTLVIFAILFILFQPMFQSTLTDSTTYINAVEENDIKAFSAPLLFFIGLVIKPNYILLPIFSIFLTFLFLYFVFQREGLNYLYVLFGFLISPIWLSFGFTFHREVLFLFLSTATFYALYLFEKTENKNNSLFFLGLAMLFAIFAIFNKTGGSILIIIIVGLLLSKFSFNFNRFPSFIAPFWVFLTNIPTKISDYIVWIVNPMFSLLFISLFHSFNKRKLGLFLIIVFSCAVIQSANFGVVHAYRYTFFLMPFTLYYIAKSKKDNLYFPLFILLLFVETIPYFLAMLQLR